MENEYNTYNKKAYRFLSFDGLENTLKFNKLRLSRADQFNDPLDNSPFLMPIEWDKCMMFGNEFLKTLSEKAFNYVLGSVYICCFSKTYTSDKSYLMWSHYAKNHTQVCFEIDFSKVKYLGNPSEVTYPDSLFEKRNTGLKNPGDLGRFIVLNKDKIWDYEQEVRLIYDRKIASNHPEVIVQNDGKNLDIPFDYKMISKVIFGYRAKEEEEISIIDKFKDLKHYPEFEKMNLNPNKLKLEPISLI